MLVKLRVKASCSASVRAFSDQRLAKKVLRERKVLSGKMRGTVRKGEGQQVKKVPPLRCQLGTRIVRRLRPVLHGHLRGLKGCLEKIPGGVPAGARARFPDRRPSVIANRCTKAQPKPRVEI